MRVQLVDDHLAADLTNAREALKQVEEARLSPRERVEYVKNDAYWDPKRKPKLERVVLLPMPEASARTAAFVLVTARTSRIAKARSGMT